MQAIIIHKIGSFEIEERPVPQPVATEVRVQVAVTGVCRTDLKIIEHGHRDLTLPRIPGEDKLCRSMQIMGFHRDGGFASHVVAPVRSILRLPYTLVFEEAVFAEPLSCCLNALERADLRKV